MSKGPAERRNWNDEELDLIVADYFAMLRDEAMGRHYSKAEHNRDLQGRIDRSQGSIEFKHQNVSAVLLKLGLPRISGYLPAANYQRAIIPAIERYILRHPEALHPERIVDGFADRQGLFVEAPPPLLPVTSDEPDIERLVRKFNPVERDFRNRKLGQDGEELVFHHEQQRLQKLDRPDLARKIRWISKELGDGAGYDILSFDASGKERLLEVKTTVGADVTPFYITRNELSLASERPDAFRLCRVFDFSNHPRMFELAPPLEKLVHLSPLNYEASFS
jgi:Protein NO VEIN, C-terminal